MPLPDGQWHIVWSHRGHWKWHQWFDSPLVEDDNLYLKEAALALKATSTLRARGKARAKALERRRAALPENNLICLIYVYNMLT